MLCCKLCHKLINMILERGIVLYKLSFLIKLKPCFNSRSVKSYCLISKGIRNACLCKVIISVSRCKKLRTVAFYRSRGIYICSRIEIYTLHTSRHRITQSLICFFQNKLASLCLRHNLKSRL